MSATLNTKSNVNNFVDDSSEEEEDVEICLPDGPLDGSDLHDPFVSRIGGLPVSSVLFHDIL